MRILYVSKASVVPAYQDKLKSLAERVEVHALLPTRWGALDTHADTSDVRFHLRPALLHGYNHFHVYRDAAGVLAAARPDLVHIDEEPYSAVTSQFARLCRSARIPFVFFAWQNIYKRLPAPFNALRRYVFAHAAAGIAGTSSAAVVLKQGGWRGPDAVIPQLGVNTTRFQRDDDARRAVRTRLGIPHDAFVAGFAGRLVPEKGVDLLLEAMAAIADDRAFLLIIGHGPERERLQAQATRVGIGARVRFAGAVDSLDMSRWLNALDAMVLPSRTTRGWSEQFGRVLTESMSCGVPVVGSRTGAIMQVMGSAGLSFAENDVASLASHLRALRDDALLRARLAEAGRTRVQEHFTQERIAADTVALYGRILARTADYVMRERASGMPA